MSRTKIIVVSLGVILAIWGSLEIFRGDYSPDIARAKKACGLTKVGNDWEWIGVTSVTGFSMTKPTYDVDTVEKYNKWLEAYSSAIAEFSQQAEDAAEAAHLDAKWRPLADAKSEFVYAHRLYFIFEVARGSISELQAEMNRLQLKFEIVIKSECGALANKLNS